MNRLLARIHAPASTQPLMPPASDKDAPVVVSSMLEKLCPDAVPLWEEHKQSDLLLLVWGDKLAACFSCSHCKEEVASFCSEVIGDTSVVYLHTDKNLPLHVANTYIGLLSAIKKLDCKFTHGVQPLQLAEEVTCWGFPHGNHATPPKVTNCLAEYEALFLSPPLVLNEQSFCCQHVQGYLLITMDAQKLVQDVTAASFHYTNVLPARDDIEGDMSNSLFVQMNDAPQHGTPQLKDFIDDDQIVHHVFVSNLPIMQTGVQQVAIFPDSHVLTFVCADVSEQQRMFVLGSLDDKHRLTPSLLLGITPPDALCIRNIISAVLKGDAELYASAFDSHSVINNCNYDAITPGTSIHSGQAHDAIVQKGTTFFKNCFANYLHWSSGGRFVCTVRLDTQHTLVIMGACAVHSLKLSSDVCTVAGVVHQGTSYCARAQAMVLEHTRNAVVAIHSWPIHTQKGGLHCELLHLCLTGLQS